MRVPDVLGAPEPPRFEPRLRCWVFSRHRDVAFALRDPRFSSDRSHRGEAGLEPEAQPSAFETMRAAMFLFRDPPSHTQLRALAQRAFTHRAIAAMERRVREVVEELLCETRECDRIDFMRRVAEPLPVVAISDILGLPAADRALLKGWSDDVAGLLLGLGSEPDARMRGRESLLELRGYLRAVLGERSARPRDDAMAHLLPLDEPERSATALLLLLAGHETTTSLLGTAVVALCEHPAQRDRLAEDPTLLGTAVEELLRFGSPLQATRRFALERVEVGDCEVGPGERVVCLLGVANRDPEVFADPNRLDLGRRDNRHLAFGSGIHACLGARLARLEARVAIGELVRRFPNFGLARPGVTWREGGVLRVPATLPLALAGTA